MSAASRKRGPDMRSFRIVAVHAFLVAKVEEARAAGSQLDHDKAKITLAQFDDLVADIAYDTRRHRP